MKNSTKYKPSMVPELVAHAMSIGDCTISDTTKVIDGEQYITELHIHVTNLLQPLED